MRFIELTKILWCCVIFISYRTFTDLSPGSDSSIEVIFFTQASFGPSPVAILMVIITFRSPQSRAKAKPSS